MNRRHLYKIGRSALAILAWNLFLVPLSAEAAEMAAGEETLAGPETTAQIDATLSKLQENNTELTAPNELTDPEMLLFMEIPDVVAGSLTATDKRKSPSTVTSITADDIQASGARSLFELLDIYVPNLQWMRHHWEGDALGMRGIISDRDDKYLLLVNGRNMNQRTHYGALSEQDQVLLSDIHHIDIVRGPGSAIYGPGAVSMVINIITFNAETFQGTELTGRLGAIEEFYTGEMKHGVKFADDNGGFFLYAGLGKYIGASKYDAPHTYPLNFPSVGGRAPSGSIPSDGYPAGEPMTIDFVGRDGAAALGMPPAKLHLELTRDNWDIWARYVRGGKQFDYATGSIARTPYGWGNWLWYGQYGGKRPSIYTNFYAYQQLTGYIGNRQIINDQFEINYAFSYQTTTTVKEREMSPVDDYREDNYYAKTMFKWRPNEEHTLAFGTEFTHMDLGLKSWGGLGYSQPVRVGTTSVLYPHAQAWGSNTKMPTWSTDMYSFLGEWQWNICEKWTAFLGGRLDNHTFTSQMFSPRATLVHTPTEKDTLKMIWARSLRTNFEEEMKRQYDADGTHSDPEKFDGLEFRYERRQNDNLDLGASAFVHYNLEAISWNNAAQQSVLGGVQREYGVELETAYHTENTRLQVSHGYTKLYSFYLPSGQDTYITAEPYGYGDDLTNWSNHITKFTWQQKLNEQWTFDASLRIYWGFPGRKDFDSYYPYAYSGGSAIIEDGWERAYRGNYYLNLGLAYQPNDALTVNVTGYNLLGIFQKDLNKRNYMDVVGSGDFRSHAPAVGVSLSYRF